MFYIYIYIYIRTGYLIFGATQVGASTEGDHEGADESPGASGAAAPGLGPPRARRSASRA